MPCGQAVDFFACWRVSRRVLQLDRESVRGKDSPYVLTDPFFPWPICYPNHSAGRLLALAIFQAGWIVAQPIRTHLAAS